MEFGGAIRMSVKKERYWKSWAEDFGETFGPRTPDLLSKKLKELVKKNFTLYKLWGRALMYRTLYDMAKQSNHTNPKSYKFLERYCQEFDGAPSLPEGLLLVDDVFDAIVKSKSGKLLSTKIKFAKQKKLPKEKLTPKILVSLVPNLPWVKRHSALWDSHVDWTVKKIWEVLSDVDRVKQIDELRQYDYKKSEMQLDVIERFMNELEWVDNIKQNLPHDFVPLVDGERPLTDHQKVAAYYFKKQYGMIDMSETGIGKTAALLTSVAASDLRKVVIICPANLIHNKQWENQIKHMFKSPAIFRQDDVIHEGFHPFSYGRRGFYLVSYNMISGPKGDTILKKLASADCIVLDEAHRTKVREELGVPSITRAKIETAITRIRKKRKLKVAMLTATPVVNAVHEPKSLLQLSTGKKYADINNKHDMYNLSVMHSYLVENALRFRDKSTIKCHEMDVDCPVELQLAEHKKVLNDSSFHLIDQIGLHEAKMDRCISMIKELNGEKVILFTKFVTGMVDTIAEALEKNGISYTYFTGTKKQGILDKEFYNGAQVMIASAAVSEGIDRLQDHCHNIWFLVHGWTAAERQQTIGRLYRKGQEHDVNVMTFYATINGFEYDKRVKMDRIHTKRMYSDVILDGNYPESLTLDGKSISLATVLDSIIEGKEITERKLLDSGFIARAYKTWGKKK